MLIIILIGLAVLALCVAIQVIAALLMIRHLARLSDRGRLGQGLWGDIMGLSSLMILLFVGHLLQIGIFAKLFVLLGEFTDYETAFYHSAVNFASLGYGDIVMSEEWRLLGALEAGNGVLMFGLSAAAMYALLMKLVESYREN